MYIYIYIYIYVYIIYIYIYTQGAARLPGVRRWRGLQEICIYIYIFIKSDASILSHPWGPQIVGYLMDNYVLR